MLPADATGAQAAPGSPARDRLAAALERIATALVRRAEAEAARRDRAERAREDEEHRLADALDADLLAELRHRVDAAIGRARAALDEA